MVNIRTLPAPSWQQQRLCQTDFARPGQEHRNRMTILANSSNRVCPMTSDVHICPILDFKWLVGRTKMGIIKAEKCWSLGGCICNTYLLAALWQVYWQMQQHPQTSHWTRHGLHFMCFWPDPRVLCHAPGPYNCPVWFSMIHSHLFILFVYDVSFMVLNDREEIHRNLGNQ